MTILTSEGVGPVGPDGPDGPDGMLDLMADFIKKAGNLTFCLFLFSFFNKAEYGNENSSKHFSERGVKIL
jgi:hypothetical protein